MVSLLLFLLIAAVLATGLGLGLIARPLVGIGLSLGILLLRSLMTEPALPFGSLNFYISDLLSGGLLAASWIRWSSRGGKINLPFKIYIPFLLYALLLVISIVRGLDSGLAAQQVLNEFRSWLLPLTLVIYLITFDLKNLTGIIVHSWLVIARLLAVIAIYIWIAISTGLPYPSLVDFSSAGYDVPRSLYSDQAFIVCIAAIFSAYKYFLGERDKKDAIWMAVFVFVVVITQHRSVWACLAMGAALALIQSSALRRRTSSLLVLALLAFSAFSIFGSDSALNRSISSTVNGAFAEQSTFSWRLIGWQQLLSPEYFQGLTEYLIGRPSGVGYPRVINGYLVDTIPHNHYVTLLTRVGIIGLLSLLFLYIRMIAVNWKGSWQNQASASVLGACLVYWVAYSASSIEPLLLALALGLWQESQKEMAVAGGPRWQTAL